MSLRNLRTSAIVVDTCCFCLCAHSLSFGNCPSSSHGIQVKLSIPGPPDAPSGPLSLGCHTTQVWSVSGVSNPTFKLIGYTKPFNPSLWFAIQTPEESRLFSFRSSAVGSWLGSMSGQLFCLIEKAYLREKEAGNSSRRRRSKQSKVLEWEKEQIN